MGSDDGTFLQTYFVYFKKKFLNLGANYPSDAADGLCGVALNLQTGCEVYFDIRDFFDAF